MRLRIEKLENETDHRAAADLFKAKGLTPDEIVQVIGVGPVMQRRREPTPLDRIAHALERIANGLTVQAFRFERDPAPKPKKRAKRA